MFWTSLPIFSFPSLNYLRFGHALLLCPGGLFQRLLFFPFRLVFQLPFLSSCKPLGSPPGLPHTHFCLRHLENQFPPLSFPPKVFLGYWLASPEDEIHPLPVSTAQLILLYLPRRLVYLVFLAYRVSFSPLLWDFADDLDPASFLDAPKFWRFPLADLLFDMVRTVVCPLPQLPSPLPSVPFLPSASCTVIMALGISTGGLRLPLPPAPSYPPGNADKGRLAD